MTTVTTPQALECKNYFPHSSFSFRDKLPSPLTGGNLERFGVYHCEVETTNGIVSGALSELNWKVSEVLVIAVVDLLSLGKASQRFLYTLEELDDQVRKMLITLYDCTTDEIHYPYLEERCRFRWHEVKKQNGYNGVIYVANFNPHPTSQNTTLEPYESYTEPRPDFWCRYAQAVEDTHKEHLANGGGNNYETSPND